jgi:hypothetical protein
MNDYFFTAFSSFSILIAVLLGAFRLRQVGRRYLPFFLFLALGFFNEIASEICGRMFQTNALNSDIYSLLDALILLWMFRCWHLVRRKWIYGVIATAFVLAWIADTMVWGTLFEFSSRFNVFYSVIVVLMAVQYINRLIVSEQRLTLNNAEFLICICLIFFYTATSIVEIFWFFGFENNKYFVGKVYVIIPVVNLVTNLLYALAVLWIPRKPAYITLS